MTRFRLTIEYDGRPFMGWQRQAHGPSVQQAIEEAIRAITHEEVVLHAAGRTDTGVHALAMTAHVDIDKPITPFRLADGTNAKLRPLPVAILGAQVVEEDFHARFSCIGRRYIYRIVNRRAPLALEAKRAWRVPVVLYADDMNKAAQALVGKHDFTTFRSAQCQAESPVKTIDRITVRRLGEVIEIEAAARSFLHHQVRSMVGCLELVGRGKWSKADLKAALEAKDRAALGFNAPPDGLYFVEASYPGER
ncbi:tRNA pseudouridine(38-40) synthase TruA [Sphingosinicella sp. LHD-64]|uniref:tRNA pseudouridine(38-40) synthase TruA n=1 Tax=Sphingosinicella sp. LHD-64 TaxID=3072139 RepID=UPI00280C6B56|nr:tRNA pseudouridine(38-40) synthase TruA [Sphingosinicella sp. LHD-64]MDQ8754691.1 tRNA pseudouridine(38-40) synthase TruA [Sphingosinicella sp. LHD-64]